MSEYFISQVPVQSSNNERLFLSLTFHFQFLSSQTVQNITKAGDFLFLSLLNIFRPVWKFLTKAKRMRILRLRVKTEAEKMPAERGTLFERFMQTVAVTSYMTFLVTGAVAAWLIWFALLFCPYLRIPLLLYAAWIYYDRGSAETGLRRSEALRRWKFWKYNNDYYPSKVIKTADLPPDKNYLFCAFPHGVFASGAGCTFGNDCNNFQELFPGLKAWTATLVQHFNTPFIREYVLSIGAIPASATCLNRLLGSKEKGNAVVLIVGGAQEAFYCEPGVYRVYLRSRKGFVRIALKNGSPLVPVITFNEPEIYNQILFKEGSFGNSFQMWFKRVTNVAPILFHGRFMFTPYRKPLFTVVGQPIPVEKVEEPTKEQVEELHAKFMQKLIDLFEKEKHKYIENADKTHLIIL